MVKGLLKRHCKRRSVAERVIWGLDVVGHFLLETPGERKDP
jgi:hypothetical protein